MKFNDGFRTNTYNEVARWTNWSKTSEFIVDPTLYEKLYGIKDEYNQVIYDTSEKPSALFVAKSCTGCPSPKDTIIRQTVSTAFS